MKKFTFQAVFFLIVIGVSLMIYKTDAVVNLPFFRNNNVAKIVVINNALIKVEVADTQEKRKAGLGGREKLASDEGMLFVFDGSGKHPFWMKGLKFALDFIWINGDKIVDVTENAKPSVNGQSDQSLPIYQSKEDANKVLEVSAGTAKNFNFKVGDMVKIQ